MAERPTIDAVLERLVADAAPVRRLWPPVLRLALWLALLAGLGAIVAWQAAPSLTGRHWDWLMPEVIAATAAAALLAGLALRAAAPDRAPSRATLVLAALAALSPTLAWLGLAPSADATTWAMYVAKGTGCALSALALALLPCASLLWAVGRGAPLEARAVGALSGGAALLAAYAAMRIVCPIDEPAHVIAWHGAPVALGAAAIAAVGGWWLARWRGGAARR